MNTPVLFGITAIKPMYTAMLLAQQALLSGSEQAKEDAIYVLDREIKYIEENFYGVKE